MTDQPARHEDRVFLVVVDKSPEVSVALKYAALRAAHSGGRVALLTVTQPATGDMQHWLGIGDIVRAEAEEEAQSLLQRHARVVHELSGKMPLLYSREGEPKSALLALLKEPGTEVSILVLAVATGSDGPGPLATWLAGRGANELGLPVTLVPASLSDADLMRLT